MRVAGGDVDRALAGKNSCFSGLNTITMRPSNPTPRDAPKGAESRCHTKTHTTNVHSGTSYSHQKETAKGPLPVSW